MGIARDPEEFSICCVTKNWNRKERNAHRMSFSHQASKGDPPRPRFDGLSSSRLQADAEDLQLLLLRTFQWCWPKWFVPGAGIPGVAAELSSRWWRRISRTQLLFIFLSWGPCCNFWGHFCSFWFVCGLPCNFFIHRLYMRQHPGASGPVPVQKKRCATNHTPQSIRSTQVTVHDYIYYSEDLRNKAQLNIGAQGMPSAKISPNVFHHV
jgi:hypothetical protein